MFDVLRPGQPDNSWFRIPPRQTERPAGPVNEPQGKGKNRHRVARRLSSVAGCLAAVAAIFACRAVWADDFRVYTQVFDDSAVASAKGAEKSRPLQPITQSLTLVHAGKVYDFIESIGEVIIFQPANRRFTILHTRRSLSTTVEFDELKHLLSLARATTEESVAEIESRQEPAGQQAARAIRFQLEPNFKEEYDANQKQLTLSSPFLRYKAQCDEGRPAEDVESYLNYADWTCRLNYVLHPNVLLPEPRLALNEALRRRHALPYVVELQADMGNALHLRAEHTFRWELGYRERDLIHQWEMELQEKSVRHVPLREYQAALVKSELSRTSSFRR